MILHLGVTQEAIKNINPNDTMIPIDILKATSMITHEQLIASKDMCHEVRTDSETTHAIVSIAHVNQAVFALEINVYFEVVNIHVLTHPYAICHVLHLAVHNIHLQTANILHH